MGPFTIDWMEDQLDHLGYPDYFAYILGVCHTAAAITIAVPGFRLVKEWAYAGVCFMWAGAAECIRPSARRRCPGRRR
ncbi:DoxX family protein [Nocardia cyriacigeorgica]|uniref:DoxX family protein n=1 Tax=Nocardia cyriacigeorgica TaxID=135487 RepID=UPI002B4AB538|nr:DoxX family protein [Nocardia cyriacigeorgica]